MTTPLTVPARERLPNRRGCQTFGFDCNNLPCLVTVSFFADGRLAEIFISNGKAGSDADAAARDSGIVCSIGLQFGAPVETIRHALLRDSRGAASSPLGIALDMLAATTIPEIPLNAGSTAGSCPAFTMKEPSNER
jgi:hypothetical protein